MKPLVIILSKQQAGGVKLISQKLHDDGYESLLLTDIHDDNNSRFCDYMLYTSWSDFDLMELLIKLQGLNVKPNYVVNLLEELIPFQILIKKQLLKQTSQDLNALSKLANKNLFRVSYGLVSHYAEKLIRLDLSSVKKFPCIIKPSINSGGSIYVYTCYNVFELQNRIQYLKSLKILDEVDFIIEEYIQGVEYSLDCYLQDGQIHPCLFVEKLDFNYSENKDGLHMISPPIHLSLKNQEILINQLYQIANKNDLKNAWLHVEFRVHEDTVRIIEINPRFGGRLYSSAIKYQAGIDPLSVCLNLQMNKSIRLEIQQVKNCEKILFITFQESFGKLSQSSNLSDLKNLPFVIDAFFIPGFKCVEYQRENFFAEFLVHGNSPDELFEIENLIRTTFKYDLIRTP